MKEMTLVHAEAERNSRIVAWESHYTIIDERKVLWFKVIVMIKY
jgi:hypothetical protein